MEKLGFLTQATGNCEKCGVSFGYLDTVPAVSVVCDRCGKKMNLCRRCKAKGCSCGGKFLDAWEKFERDHPGGTILF